MKKPLITTVIPTFQRPKLLKKAIESVLAQSFSDLLICVYDNNSEDETEEVVKNLIRQDNRIIYFKNTENIGPLLNIKNGIEAVNTPFYSLLSDDDFLLPDFYKNAIDAIKKHPDAEFICSKTIAIDLLNNKLQYRNQDWQAGFYNPSNNLVSKMHVSHFVSTGVLFSNHLREIIGIFEPSGSDSLYLTIAAASVPFVVLEGYGAAVTLHENAYSVVGEGIVKEDIQTLYKHLIFTISIVMSLNIPSDRKIHLLMHILKSYQQHFDTKELNHLMNKTNEYDLEKVTSLPSLVTNRKLMVKTYNFFPKNIRFLIIWSFKLVRFIKWKLGKKSQGEWVDLTNEARLLLESKNINIPKFLSLIQPDSKINKCSS